MDRLLDSTQLIKTLRYFVEHLLSVLVDSAQRVLMTLS